MDFPNHWCFFLSVFYCYVWPPEGKHHLRGCIIVSPWFLVNPFVFDGVRKVQPSHATTAMFEVWNFMFVVEIPVPRKWPQTKIESNINMFAEGLLHHNPKVYHHVPYVSIYIYINVGWKVQPIVETNPWTFYNTVSLSPFLLVKSIKIPKKKSSLKSLVSN